MVASGPTTFFVEPWNVLDFCIVIASVLAIALKDAPGFSLMRMVRLFRVIRMVEQFTQLRRIVTAIVASVVPMCSALFVLFLVSSIYSLVAVDLMVILIPQEVTTSVLQPHRKGVMGVPGKSRMNWQSRLDHL